MVNVRKNAMREYHNLIHRKKYLYSEPQRYPATFQWMSKEEWEMHKREYESVCEQIELLKKILEFKK